LPPPLRANRFSTKALSFIWPYKLKLSNQANLHSVSPAKGSVILRGTA
jgi:hypothetical protein